MTNDRTATMDATPPGEAEKKKTGLAELVAASAAKAAAAAPGAPMAGGLPLAPEAAPLAAAAEATTAAAERPRPPSVAEGGMPVDGSALSEEELTDLTERIIAALKTVYDPEIPSDIYELGLIYKIDISDSRWVDIDMTLTAPGCPVAGEMPTWVENAVIAVPGVSGATVKIVFDPPWDQSRMSDEARLSIGMF